MKVRIIQVDPDSYHWEYRHQIEGKVFEVTYTGPLGVSTNRPNCFSPVPNFGLCCTYELS